MTKFEDKLREALAVDDRPVSQIGTARYSFANKYKKSHTSVIEDAAALLLEILPEIREITRSKSLLEHTRNIDVRSTRFEGASMLGDQCVCFFNACDTSAETLTEKLKKAGVV